MVLTGLLFFNFSSHLIWLSVPAHFSPSSSIPCSQITVAGLAKVAACGISTVCSGSATTSLDAQGSGGAGGEQPLADLAPTHSNSSRAVMMGLQ